MTLNNKVLVIDALLNLFLEKELEFKSPELKNNVKKIIKNVYNQNMSNNEYFDFAITKKENMIITD